MKRLFKAVVILSIFNYSCNNLSQNEKKILEIINNPICLEIFDSIQVNDKNKISYDEFRKSYKFILIIYLVDSCNPCYSKYHEWNKRSDNLKDYENFNMLFIIQGYSFESFISNVRSIGLIKGNYNIIIDPYRKFVEFNNLPVWLMNDAFILIDNNNKVRLIGNPFATPDMTKLFYSIISEDGRN